MAYFVWKESFSVNIQKIDEQHKKLISMIDQLYEAMAKSATEIVLEKLLADLIEYTKTHFADEEALLQKHGYPEYSLHKAKHVDFIRQIHDFEKQFHDGSITLSLTMSMFLQDWLANHILKMDKKYASFLTAKGIK